MFFFYLLVAVMPLDQHWFWRWNIVGSVTMLKVLGFVCLGLALARISLGHSNPRLLSSTVARWYLVFVLLQFGSFFLHGGVLGVDPSVYWHVASITTVWITTLTFVNSSSRLSRTLLVAVAASGFASLYTIRGAQMSVGDFRPSGIFNDANYYALVVGMWIPLAFLWAFSRRPVWERLLCLGCLVAMLLGTTFASSRGGFLGLAAAFLFVVWHSQKRFRKLVIVAVLTVPLVLFTPNSPWHRLTNPSYGDQEAQQARLVAWKAALRMIRAHPLTGIGLGNFKPLMQEYDDTGSTVVSVTHNTYLETAAEMGIPALIVHMGILSAVFITLSGVRRRARAAGAKHLYTLALGLQAGLISYLVSAFFVSSWWLTTIWFPFFSAICLDRLNSSALVSRKYAGDPSSQDLPAPLISTPIAVE
jgi:hypothetical protein